VISFLNKPWCYALYGLTFLVGLLVLLLTMAALVVMTESGSRRISEAVIGRIDQLAGISLEVESIDGNLFRGLQLNGVEFGTDSVIGSVVSIEASWNPYSLLSGTFSLSDLMFDSLVLKLSNEEGAQTNSVADVIAMFSFEVLPLPIRINNLRFDDIVVDGSQRYAAQFLSASLELSQQNLQLDRLEFSADTIQFEGSLSAVLVSRIPVATTLEWQYSGLIYEGIESASGRLSITGDLGSLNIQHQLHTPVQIQSAGTIQDPFAGALSHIDLSHSAPELILPIDALQQTVLSNVALQTTMTDGDIGLEFESDVSTSNFPALRLTAAGIVREQSLALSSVLLTSQEGVLEGAGQLNWADGIAAHVEYELAERNPLAYFEINLPLDLSDISSTGEIDYQRANNSEQRIDLEIQTLDGRLGEYPLQGSGNLSLMGKSMKINKLQLSAAGNQIDLRGTYDENLLIEWELSAPQLDQLSSEISGSAIGSGSVRGSIDLPEIVSQFSFEDLQTDSIQLQSLEITLEGVEDVYVANLNISNAVFVGAAQTESIERANISLRGNLESQQIDIDLQSEFANLDLSILGGAANTETRHWAGQITDAHVTSALGNWISTTITPFEIGPAGVSLQDNCWLNRETEFCVQLSSNQFESFELQGSLRNFPLAEFNFQGEFSGKIIDLNEAPRLPQGISLQGLASGQFTARTTLSREIEFDFSALAENSLLLIEGIAVDDFESDSDDSTTIEQQYNWERLAVNGSYHNNAWEIDGSAALNEQNIDDTGLQLNGLLEADLIIDAERLLFGTTNADFQDLGWIEVFLPELSNVKGSLQSNLSISGSLESPLIAGEVSISNGSFFANRLGVAFTGFETTILGESTGSAQLNGRVSSGEGSLEFDGSAVNLYGNDREVIATLRGSDFQFVEIPDLSLSISPQMTLTGHVDGVHLAGALELPVFNLNVRELPTSAVNVSRDVVVTSYPSDRPDLERSLSAGEATLFDIPVTADLKISLGEQVSFSGFGLQAALQGSLDIQQLAGGSNLTYGELNVTNGSYQTYGQTLELQQGKLLFFGAYDNPALDIRAIREVNGITVGVLMNGTLKNIDSQLFSTPALADSDIISVLVTGRPFSQLGSQDGDAVLGAIATLGIERGQGLSTQIRDRLGFDTLAITNTGDINSSQLTVGKYLTPEVFVRYGVGLFDNRSKMAVDYTFPNNIILQAESGEYQSIDLTYKIER
jgi:translocation and assembly module TamB